MLFPSIHYEKTLKVPLGSVDAELAMMHELNHQAGMILNRAELVPGRLVSYVLIVQREQEEYGECGRIFIQYLGEAITRISFEVSHQDFFPADHFTRNKHLALLGGINPDQLSKDQLIERNHLLFDLRYRALAEVCETVRMRLEDLDPLIVIPAQVSTPRLPSGRPSLPDEELIRRLALVILEKRLKASDPGLTRKEFVFKVHTALKYLITPSTLKNAAHTFGELERQQDEHLLPRAARLADTWQSSLE